MQAKVTLILLTILVAAVLAGGPSSPSGSSSPVCPSNHIWNNGCVKMCTHPDFSKCGQVVPITSNPNYCSLSRSGQWKTETYSCGACQNPTVIGIRDGNCGCEVTGCPQGQRCVNSRCQPGTPQPPQPPIPPTIPGCGFNCPFGFKCVYNKCVPQYGYCNNQNDCQSYELCINGKCEDRCTTIRCSSGYQCVKGSCVPNPAQCRYSYECPNGYVCNNGKCVDKCAGVVCIATHSCKDGECVPICDNVRCSPGY